MNNRRIQILDFLRGIAVLLVLFRHQQILPFLESFGWMGVDLFFVLSGFLVSGLLFAEHKQKGVPDVKRFFIRRAWKIYPAFIVMLLVTVLIDQLIGFRPLQTTSSGFFNAFLVETTFLQSYFTGLWNHTWSLGVEEHFYLFLAVSTYVVFKYSADPKTHMKRLALTVMILSGAWKLYNSLMVGVSDVSYASFASHLRADSLMAGVLLSWYWHYEQEDLREVFLHYRMPLIAFACWSFAVAFWMNRYATQEWITSIGFIALYSSFTVILGLLLTMPEGWEKKLPGWVHDHVYTKIARIGFYSYSIYLWHMLVYRYALGPDAMGISSSSLTDYTHITLYYTGSIAVGVFMSHAIEIPALYIRDHGMPKVAFRLPFHVQIRFQGNTSS